MARKIVTGFHFWPAERGWIQLATSKSTELVLLDVHPFIKGDTLSIRKNASPYGVGLTDGGTYYVMGDAIRWNELRISATGADGPLTNPGGDIYYDGRFMVGATSEEVVDCAFLATLDEYMTRFAIARGDSFHDRGDRVAIQCSSATDSIVRSPGHGFRDGTPISFLRKVGGNNIRLGKTYYVRDADGAAGTFRVAEAPGLASPVIALGSDMEAYAQRLAQGAAKWPTVSQVWVDWIVDTATFLPGNWVGGTRSGFPTTRVTDALALRGVNLMILWQLVPYGGGPNYNGGVEPNSILQGTWNPYIDDVATKAATYGKPVIIRLLQEHNIGYPWGQWGDGLFVAVWRYIHDRVRSIAPNVSFSWNPWYTTGNPNISNWANKYPGNDWVEYIGFDAYQGLNANGQMPYDAFKPAIVKVRGLSGSTKPGKLPGAKPILIGECGIRSGEPFTIVTPPVAPTNTLALQDRTSPSDTMLPSELAEPEETAAGSTQYRRRWVGDGYRGLYDQYRDLACIMYFDIDMRFLEGNNVWRMDARPTIVTKMGKTVGQTKFRGRFTGSSFTNGTFDGG